MGIQLSILKMDMQDPCPKTYDALAEQYPELEFVWDHLRDQHGAVNAELFDEIEGDLAEQEEHNSRVNEWVGEAKNMLESVGEEIEVALMEGPEEPTVAQLTAELEATREQLKEITIHLTWADQ